MKNNLAIAASAIILVTALAMTSCTTVKVSPVKTDQIRVSYVPPTDASYQDVYEFLSSRQTLEKLKEFLSPFRLEWVLNITLAECDGEADAMYADDMITICYEYIEDLRKRVPAKTTPAGVEPVDVLIGPFFDAILHEFAHALFDYADIPVLGREEDAADQVAAYIYLQLDKADARRLIMGTAYSFLAESRDSPPPTMADFSGEHSTPEQRAFNLLCMAYGKDPETYGDIAVMGGLTRERAEYCGEEFELISLAYEALIEPHVDPDLARIVYQKQFVPGRSEQLLIRQR